MVYNGVNFNKEFWDGKSEARFLKEEAHHGLTDVQLKEAFSLLQTKRNEPNRSPRKDEKDKE